MMSTHDIINDNVFVDPSSESNLSVNNSNQKVRGTPSPTGYRDYEPPTELLDNDYQAVSRVTHDFRNVSEKDKEAYSEITHKTILLGDSGVGKTSLLVQFDTGTFQPRNFAATVGIGFTNKVVSVDGTQVKLQIWDTAGQERFRSVTHAYYRDAHALLLLYDITSKTSYDNIRAWLSEIREHANDDVVIALLGNKSDCEKERAVKKEEGERLAREYKVPFMETSAKTGLNVELAFLTVARLLICSDKDTNDRDGNKFNIQDFINQKSHQISCSHSGCLT